MAAHDIWLLWFGFTWFKEWLATKETIVLSIDEHLLQLVIIQHSLAGPVIPYDEVKLLCYTLLGIFNA